VAKKKACETNLTGLVLAGQKIPDHKPPKFSKDKQIKHLGFNASF